MMTFLDWAILVDICLMVGGLVLWAILLLSGAFYDRNRVLEKDYDETPD